MEPAEFHNHEPGPRFIGKCHPVAGVLPGVGSDSPGFADAARGDHDGLGFENDEAAGFAPIREGAGDAATVRQEARDRAFHVDIDALLNSAVLKRANHFQAGAVADVAEALESVAAESTLQNVAILGAVEEGAPLFELAYPIGRFLGVKL